MKRIICDILDKKGKHLWGKDATTEFNQRILAVNAMYQWLYNTGVLKKISFEFKDFLEETYFAFDVTNLIPYRKEMETAPIADPALAVRYIFDEEIRPCMYCGAIELGWSLLTYRDIDGCVSKSWECNAVRSLNTNAVFEILKVLENHGIEAAVSAAFSMYEWDLTLDVQEAVKFYHLENDPGFDKEFLQACGDHLAYCHQHGHDLLDFDCWIRYEALCDQKLSFDEYLILNDFVGDIDPYDIQDTDTEMIRKLKALLLINHQKKDTNKKGDNNSWVEKFANGLKVFGQMCFGTKPLPRKTGKMH